ncbi:DUF6124 family protein [Pseudomonas frederiksbergensis]|uniref:DUF6124 family protein n=1 Tax=Pseudomonas frederiksbergensis TaxID=104087 RepID=UPI003D1A7830
MFKPTPNPPETDDTSIDRQKLQEAADRALDDYINLTARLNASERKPSTMFMVAPDNKTESLLAHASESLASASVMANDFATGLKGSQRSTVLGIIQNIMLGEMAVNRALDNLDPQD